MSLKLPAPLRAWYAGLVPRERRLVLIGSGVIALMIVYLAIISPISTAHTRLMRDVRAKRQLITYIDNAAARLQTQSSASIGQLPAGQSVFAALSAAIQSSPVSGAVQRLEQTQDGGVRLSLRGAAFDSLARWLATIASQDGIVVTRATIDQATNPGTVNATLTLNQHE